MASQFIGTHLADSATDAGPVGVVANDGLARKRGHAKACTTLEGVSHVVPERVQAHG